MMDLKLQVELKSRLQTESAFKLALNPTEPASSFSWIQATAPKARWPEGAAGGAGQNEKPAQPGTAASRASLVGQGGRTDRPKNPLIRPEVRFGIQNGSFTTKGRSLFATALDHCATATTLFPPDTILVATIGTRDPAETIPHAAYGGSMKCAGSNLDVKDQQPPWSDHCTCPLCKREVIMTAQGTVAAHVSDLEAAAPIASSLEQRFVWIREADDYDNR